MTPETMTRDDELTGARSRRHAGRVLLVSECADEQGMYADYFRLKGFCALETYAAPHAYTLATELRPAAVVTDAVLPGPEDGVWLTGRLKQTAVPHRISNVSVVMIDAHLNSWAKHALNFCARVIRDDAETLPRGDPGGPTNAAQP